MKSLLSYILLTIILIVFSFVYYPKYQHGSSEATISWDVSGYYWYLPALFVYKDLKGLNFSDSLRNAYQSTPENLQITDLPNGKKVMKYSSGMALQYAPLFLLAHSLARPLGYPPDGLSLPYQLSVHIGSLCMMLLGIWFLRKLLLDYFKDTTVAICLFFMLLGTNYLNYVAIDVGMSHAWLFSVYCMLMYATNLFYRKVTFKLAAVIGFLSGLLILSRPSEMIAVLIPLLWGISSLRKEEWKMRIRFVMTHYSKYLLAILCLTMMGCIQIFYWKYASGDWLVYSYGDQKFSWLHPHLITYVFGFRSGWLIYCPMMILAIIGFPLLLKRKINFVAILVFFLLNLWIVTAWDVYWYGGRAMLQGSAVLVFPLCCLIEFTNQKRLAALLLFYPVALLFLYLNIWWTHGVHKGDFILSNDMSQAYYWKIAGNFQPDPRDRKFLFLTEDFTGEETNIKILYSNDFETDTTSSTPTENSRQLFLKHFESESFTPAVSNEMVPRKWLRFSADIECLMNNWYYNSMSQMGIRFWNNEKPVKIAYLLLDQLFYKERKQEIFIDIKIPREQYTKVEVFFLNPKDALGSFFVDNLKVIAFDEK